MAQDLHYAFTGSTFWWSSRLRYVTMITLRAHAVIYIRVTKHCFNTLNQTTLSIFSPPGPYSKSLPTTESFTLLTADGDGLISSLLWASSEVFLHTTVESVRRQTEVFSQPFHSWIHVLHTHHVYVWQTTSKNKKGFGKPVVLGLHVAPSTLSCSSLWFWKINIKYLI